MSKRSKQKNKLKRLIKKGNNKVATIAEHIQNETGLKGHWEPMVDLVCPNPACGEVEYMYAYDDKKTLYCMACGKECDVADIMTQQSDEYEVEFTDVDGNTSGVYLNKEYADVKAATDAALSGTSTSGGQKTIAGFGPSQWWEGGVSKWCEHKPQHVINGRNYDVWAGKKADCLDSLGEFNVVLNLTFNSVKERHNIPIPQLKKYENRNGEDFIEIQLDWPDYGITSLPRQFWIDLINYLDENKFKMVVFCLGGHGRTGTAIASMLTVLGYAPQDAIKFVRENYCPEAIESKSQEWYIQHMALVPPEVVETAKESPKQLVITDVN